MRIYFSGIGGTGINPLANLALDANFTVIGTDKNPSQNTDQLKSRGVDFSTDQSGDFLSQKHSEHPIDWLIYTSSLPKEHPELVKAKQLGIRTTKRDEFINFFIKKHNFKMIAVAGTHGKTSTTTMLIWLFKQLNIPTSYLVGSTLEFGNAGHFEPNSRYFIYEADEYDRNFLHFEPEYSIITAIDWDHVDIYPTQNEYFEAFSDFINQSKHIFIWQKDKKDVFDNKNINLAKEINLKLTLFGVHNRQNAQLVLELAKYLDFDLNATIEAVNSVKTAGRRFEKLKPNLISDYAHHPTEIKATLQMIKEYCQQLGFNKIIAVYEPHQVARQQQFKDDYKNAFELADQVYWLPTYLARGNQKPMTATELNISFDNLIEKNFDQELITTINNHLKNNDLVIMMSAGKLDFWARQNLL